MRVRDAAHVPDVFPGNGGPPSGRPARHSPSRLAGISGRVGRVHGGVRGSRSGIGIRDTVDRKQRQVRHAGDRDRVRWPGRRHAGRVQAPDLDATCRLRRSRPHDASNGALRGGVRGCLDQLHAPVVFDRLVRHGRSGWLGHRPGTRGRLRRRHGLDRHGADDCIGGRQHEPAAGAQERVEIRRPRCCRPGAAVGVVPGVLLLGRRHQRATLRRSPIASSACSSGSRCACSTTGSRWPWCSPSWWPQRRCTPSGAAVQPPNRRGRAQLTSSSSVLLRFGADHDGRGGRPRSRRACARGSIGLAVRPHPTRSRSCRRCSSGWSRRRRR